SARACSRVSLCSVYCIPPRTPPKRLLQPLTKENSPAAGQGGGSKRPAGGEQRRELRDCLDRDLAGQGRGGQGTVLLVEGIGAPPDVAVEGDVEPFCGCEDSEQFVLLEVEQNGLSGGLCFVWHAWNRTSLMCYCEHFCGWVEQKCEGGIAYNFGRATEKVR